MNNLFAAKYLQHLNKKKADNKEKGFTLIELLVVVIIIGVLAAVALPNLLSQVGKARESEAKTGVGSINRSQQTYHFERQTFANGVDVEAANNSLGVVINPDFFTFAVTANGGTDASVVAIDANAANNGTRNYAGGIGFASGAYDSALCQSNDVGGTATAVVTTPTAIACDGTSTELN